MGIGYVNELQDKYGLVVKDEMEKPDILDSRKEAGISTQFNPKPNADVDNCWGIMSVKLVESENWKELLSKKEKAANENR